MIDQIVEEHDAIDILVNNAGRSIRRAIAQSCDRFHDFERTMQLNYFGSLRLILRALPGMSARRTGQVINVSSIGVLSNSPRFSAYVASKAALDAFSRCASAEYSDTGIAFTTINMPLVRTPMIAPTKMYDNVPTILIKECLEETNGERGLNLTRKLHSIFVEFMVYQRLITDGFQMVDFNRTQGSCDLIMAKNSKTYNFEVKFKESIDISRSRLFDYIDGMSFLEENSFLRGNNFEIYLKTEKPNYQEQKKILNEINKFIEGKNDIYEGDHIAIFPPNKRREAISRDILKVSKYLNSLHVSNELTETKYIGELVKKIFIDNNGHITKMINKSKRIDNFKGFLVWSIPCHKEIDIKRYYKW